MCGPAFYPETSTVSGSASTEREMKKLFVRFLKDQSGVTAIEYGLIAGLVAVTIIGALGILSGGLITIFTTVGTDLTNAAGGA